MKPAGRVTIDPAQVGGVPCIRDLRIPEATILAEYPDLKPQDFPECLRCAAALDGETRNSLT